MSSVTCHCCESAMERTSGYAAWACPECPYIADEAGLQREYNSGRPCDCPPCQALAQKAQAEWDALSPFDRGVRLIGHVLVELTKASLARRH